MYFLNLGVKGLRSRSGVGPGAFRKRHKNCKCKRNQSHTFTALPIGQQGVAFATRAVVTPSVVVTGVLAAAIVLLTFVHVCKHKTQASAAAHGLPGGLDYQPLTRESEPALPRSQDPSGRNEHRTFRPALNISMRAFWWIIRLILRQKIVRKVSA